jgi:hypothetical protein
MAPMDPDAPPDDAPPPAPRRAGGFGRMLFSAIVSSAILAGVLWAVTTYLLKYPRQDWRLFLKVFIGGVVSRVLLWPLAGRRVPGLVLEALSLAVFLLVSYGGYVYVWPALKLRLG